MRATTINGPYDIRLDEVADPTIALATDAIVTVIASCICGSDLWPYRGEATAGVARRIGHEFIGVVAEVGAEVRTLRVGDVVIAPFVYSDGTCSHCALGVQTSCESGGFWGSKDRTGHGVDGGQGEIVRVPFADGTLVRVPEVSAQDLAPGRGPGSSKVRGDLSANLLTLSDVMGTGHHAAVAAGVSAGSTVVVIGDGAVGLCAVLAASRLGADRIVSMSRHATRGAVAKAFGASDLVSERGAEGTAAVLDLLGGLGPDAVLECVGTGESMDQALATVRPGGRIGYVGVPHGVQFPVEKLFMQNIGIGGGIAPVRAYIPALLDDVLAGVIEPGLVFDLNLPLSEVAEGYQAMDERRAIKVLLRP